MATWANASDSAPTIALNGHDLIVDADAISYNVTITNTGGTCHLELRDGGRIKLAATLPPSVGPWVDPENPLPESNYVAGLMGNASAEIQLNGNFSLGGAPASLPTATRNGHFWGKCVTSPTANSIVFDRDFPLRSKDYVFCISYYNCCQLVEVSSYDSPTKTATFSTNLPTRNAGSVWALFAGGVAIINKGSSTVVNAPIRAGTVVVKSNDGRCFSGETNICRCLFWHGTTSYTNGDSAANPSIGFVNQLACQHLFPKDVNVSLKINEAAFMKFTHIDGVNIRGNLKINGGVSTGAIGYLQDFGVSSGPGNVIHFANVNYPTMIIPRDKSAVSFSNCIIGNNQVEDTHFETSGTVSRVSRSSFPVDTDLPDAFYHAPATASDTTWRYEDYWVRKGETLRLSCRAMRGGDNGTARVAIGEMSVWVPAAGMPVLAEWKLDSGEPLVWRGRQIQWTNDMDEDRQVRVWSMGSGINGAYIRVWRATGGAM